jgi:hypothetical protein
VGDPVRIGYSSWGFLGPGILDTPDGGRSHRRTLDGLTAAGHDLVFLQPNRDLNEAGLDLRHCYRWDGGLPDIDLLFCEWRWPIPGRNTSRCGNPGHTCDLHRQDQLIAHYTLRAGTATLLWDKDVQLPSEHPLRTRSNVAVCEPALYPRPGAISLLFPVADAALDAADPAALAAQPRPVPLVYVGNQYGRDDAFGTFFAPAAAHVRHRVAGKWNRTHPWPGLNFTGRCPFTDVEPLHSSALATVLLLPDRYARAGQMTQRVFEAVLAGCLPLTPATIRGAEHFTPAELHIHDATDVLALLRRLEPVAGSPTHAELIAACLRHLDMFRLSRQITTLNQTLERLHDGDRPAPATRHPATLTCPSDPSARRQR